MLKLIYSKTTGRYILIAPGSYNHDAWVNLKTQFAKDNNIPEDQLIVLQGYQSSHNNNVYVEI